MQIQTEISSCFEEISEVLRSREKQLLRQAEAIHRQQLSLVETSLDFLPSSIVVLTGRSELEEQIHQFGNIEIHGSNGITVKDVEPYKVVDYQDANKDHVSFDKTITCQKARSHQSLPRCKDFVSNYKTYISNLSPALLVENQLQGPWNVKGNTLMHFNDTLSLSRFSPLLIIKHKLGLTHVSLDGLHAFDRAYPQSIRSFKMSCKTTESCKLDALLNEMTQNDLQKLEKISKEDNPKLIKCQKEQKKNYEHPMQVQHWLRQILAETEIEPAIYEMGQFSEISKAKLCNEL